MKLSFLFLCSVFICNTVKALELPEPLQQWQQWVLHKHPQARCSFRWNQFEDKFCAWPSNLSLQVNNKGMQFEQRWLVEADSWLSLPGSRQHWPTSVTVDGRPQPVTERGDRPAVYMKPGRHSVEGFIPWSRLPEKIAITPSAALVTLSVNGETVAVPNIDSKGMLWLRRDAKAEKQKGKSKLPTRVQVYRKLTDGVPLKLETDLRLRVSGAARELEIGRALPEGFELMALDSPLPARLEKDGRLRIQVRQGSWKIKLVARNTGTNNSFTVTPLGDLWPTQEVWVFKSRPQLRAITVEGVSAIDPQQTNVPDKWRKLPAYLLTAEEKLVLAETSRGDATPAPDKLELRRELWFDFDGGGATVRDQFSGDLNQAQRLTTLQPLKLGRADISGRPQLITTLGANDSGLELRQGSVDLQAVSRIDSRQRSFSAVGWNHSVDALRIMLHLPPGWQLFAARGVDQAPATWVAKWSLFDIFLVLVISTALLRMFGKRVGLLAFFTLLVTFHASGAPKFIWLNLAVTLALLRVVPRGKLRWLLSLWRNLTVLSLILVSLLFAVKQLQQAVYPMLERSGHVNASMIYGDYRKAAGETRGEKAPVSALEDSVAADGRSAKRATQSQVAPPQQQYDADAAIQTGPGVPTWEWQSAVLSWSGPVVQDQQLRLWLLPPILTRLLKLAGVILLVALIASLARHHSSSFGKWRPQTSQAALSLGFFACVLAGMLFPGPAAYADVPDADLLQELQQRLLEPPPCAPSCAAISAARLRMTDNTLLVELSIDAQHQVAMPLPAKRGVWLPAQVQLNGAASGALINDGKGVLHIALPAGRSRVRLSGKVFGNQLRLPMPAVANNVSVSAPGWHVSGLVDGRVQSGSLQLQKQQDNKPGAEPRGLLPNPIVPFVEIQRVLRLGVDWYVETTVSRVAPRSAAINLTVPLLAGEQLLSDSLKQVDGAVQVSLRRGQNSLRWRSSLDKVDSLELTAEPNSNWSEVWELASDTRWHVEWSGFAPVKQQARGAQVNPRWLPRSGERLQISVQEPQALPGASQTLEQLRLKLRPGVRRSAVDLTLQLRAGHAGPYNFSLPAGAQLQSIMLDGQDLPLPADAQQLSLPLRPGVQELQLRWQGEEKMQLRTETPALDLGLPATNINLEMSVPAGRWLLAVGGPSIGPAMLVWGVVLVIVAVSVFLGRLGFLPLRTWEWLLLGIGMSTINAYGAALMVIWFLAMHARGTVNPPQSRWQFNGLQLLLGALTVAALMSLLASIPWGLLGSPNMQIAGNGSFSSVLYWYQDRSAQQLPQGWVLSLPIWAYRIVMLLWSLWLAFAVIRWLQWGWQKFSHDALWKPKHKVVGDSAAAQ